MKITVEGDKELQAAIQQALSSAPRLVEEAIKNTIEETSAVAVEKAPVDTGFLKSKISTSHGPNYGEVHSRAIYSGYVEFGTRYMSSQPYMRPAYEKGRVMLYDLLKDVAEGMFK